MAIRIDRVYTGTGDTGETSLPGGLRVPKDSPRIDAFGTVDELNSFVGLALAEMSGPASDTGRESSSREGLSEIRDILLWVQQKLFDLGAYLATPPEKLRKGSPSAGAGDVARLEEAMDRWTRDLPPLNSFVLPGGGKASAWLHACRTVCRRAEREVLRLHRESPVEGAVLIFLNRLSDLFFVAARRAAQIAKEFETLWNPSPPAPGDPGGRG